MISKRYVTSEKELETVYAINFMNNGYIALYIDKNGGVLSLNINSFIELLKAIDFCEIAEINYELILGHQRIIIDY